MVCGDLWRGVGCRVGWWELVEDGDMFFGFCIVLVVCGFFFVRFYKMFRYCKDCYSWGNLWLNI